MENDVVLVRVYTIFVFAVPLAFKPSHVDRGKVAVLYDQIKLKLIRLSGGWRQKQLSVRLH